MRFEIPRPLRATAVRGAALALAGLLLPCLALAGQVPPSWTAGSASAHVTWLPDALAGLGVEVRQRPAGDRLDSTAPSGLELAGDGRTFLGVAGGSLHFPGGFVLAHGGHEAALADFDLRPAGDGYAFDLVGADGALLATADFLHYKFDPRAQRLRLFNLDLRIAATLAERLGDPHLSGQMLARLEIESRLEPTPGGAISEAPLVCSNPQWAPTTGRPTDVAIIDVSGISQVARSGGRVAVAFDATLQNVGCADVPWYAKFYPDAATLPPYNTDQHPYLAWGMYRIASGGGTIEQIGASPLKHAFFATNASCGSCWFSGEILWAKNVGMAESCSSVSGHPSTNGCQDTYGTGNNDSEQDLGPREELEAHSGKFTSTCSFFDPNCDGSGDATPRASTFDRRMGVTETDLQIAGATYYFDGWYIIRDDVDIYNTMGWRRVTPTFGGSSWTFPTATSLANGSVLDAWVSRSAPPAGAKHVRLVAQDEAGKVEGHLSLAVKTTNAGGGITHYEYALFNHDYDRRIQSFAIPIPAGTAITNPGFHGRRTNPATHEDQDVAFTTDWTVEVTPTAVVFRAADPATLAQDWGTLFTFRFDANVVAGNGVAGLGSYESGTTLLIDAQTMTPSALVANLFGDGFETGNFTRWSATGF
jgi:hypothetical protein